MDEELKKVIESTAADTRRHFDVVAEKLDAKIQLVAEGVAASTARIERLSSDMKAEFGDVRSMIKFSHAELDRRIRTEGFADLQTRVERLESSTH